VYGNEIGSGFHPDHAKNGHGHGRHVSTQEGQWSNMTQKTAVIFGMMLLVGGRKAGRLRHKEQAQQQQHGEVSPRSTALNCHSAYSIYPPDEGAVCGLALRYDGNSAPCLFPA
jgi:hypothetical protein